MSDFQVSKVVEWFVQQPCNTDLYVQLMNDHRIRKSCTICAVCHFDNIQCSSKLSSEKKNGSLELGYCIMYTIISVYIIHSDVNWQQKFNQYLATYCISISIYIRYSLDHIRFL